MISATPRWLGLAVATVALFASAPAFSQAVTTAALRGTVEDAAGGPIAGATVVAVHLPSGSEYGASTNANGVFNLRGLRVGGPYRVQASFIGFSTTVEEGLRLQLGETGQLSLVLRDETAELGEVVVTGQADAIFDPSRTGIGTNISSETVAGAPQVGRDIADFARLSPLAYVDNDDDDGPAVSIAGQNNRYNTIYIDGAVSNDVFGLSAQGTNGGQSGATPISLDAVDQVQIQVSPFDVTQSGFTGGAINLVTKSGTNSLEGSLFGLLRDEQLAGEEPVIRDFNAATGEFEEPGEDGEILAEFENYRYGGSIGGPIVRDRVFFFANAEFLESSTPQPAAFNAGTFANVYQGDASLEQVQGFQEIFDALGYDIGGFEDQIGGLNSDQVLVKLDASVNQQNSLSARYNYLRADNVDAFASRDDEINFGANFEIFPNRTHSVTGEWNFRNQSTIANKLLIGYTNVEDDRDPNTPDGAPFEGLPFVRINDGSGDINFGSERFSTANLLTQDILEVTNNFNYFAGDHTITIGARAEFYDIGNLFIAENFGVYDYDNVDDALQSVCAINEATRATAACQALQDRRMLPAGYGPAVPDAFRRGFSLRDDDPSTPQFEDIAGDGSNSIAAFTALQLGLYAQDEWQVNPNLRVTGGLRLDVPSILDTPPLSADALEAGGTRDRIVAAGYDLNGALPETAVPFDGSDSVIEGSAPSGVFYLAPRVGFNYTFGRGLVEDGTFQLRGGAGLFTGRTPFVWPGGLFNDNGVRTSTARSFDGLLPDGSPIPFVPNPAEALNAQDLDANFSAANITSRGELVLFEEDFLQPFAFRGSLGADFDLPGGLVATVEGQFTNYLQAINVTDVNLNPAALRNLDGPDRRPVYFPTSDLNGDGSVNAADARLDDRYDQILRVSGAGGATAYSGTVQLGRDFRDAELPTVGGEPLFDGASLNLAYTYGQSFAVNDGTSSRIISIYRFNENVNGLNFVSEDVRDEVASTLPDGVSFVDGVDGASESDFSPGHIVRAFGSVRRGGTTLSLFYTAESGRPFAYTIDQSSNLRGDFTGSSDASLLFVPANPGDLTFETPEDQARFEQFVASSDHLSSLSNEYANRGGARTPFEGVFDLRLQQRLFGGFALGGRARSLDLTLDLFNLNNLLNPNWGRRHASFFNVNVLEFRGFVDDDNSDGTLDLTPVYRYDLGSTTNEAELFERRTITDGRTYGSRWLAQVGLRLSF